MNSNSKNNTSWNNLFPFLKKSLFFFVAFVFIAGNIVDILSNEVNSINKLNQMNSLYIVFSILVLIIYLLNYIRLKTACILTIYAILANLIITLIFNISQPNFEKLFLRELIIVNLMFIPVGFLINKKHIFSYASIFLTFFIYVIFIPENTFIRKSATILLLEYFSYASWVYFLILLLEKWFQEQQNLYLKLEQQNISLAKKSKELDKMNKTKDRLFSIIAHDLRNPFNTIHGFSELLIRRKETITKEKRERYIIQINHSSEESINLLDNLFEWATSQTGDIHFNPEELDLNSIIINLLDYFEVNSTDKEITILKSYSDDISINADKNMLTTILRNLLSNAIKYTPRKGSIKIGVEPNKEHTLFFVEDTGIGINAYDKEKLFDLDHKVQRLGTERERGTGLGLTICKDFIKRHRGKIWVESEPDKGTTFYFTIPNIYMKG